MFGLSVVLLGASVPEVGGDISCCCALGLFELLGVLVFGVFPFCACMSALCRSAWACSHVAVVGVFTSVCCGEEKAKLTEKPLALAEPVRGDAGAAKR